MNKTWSERGFDCRADFFETPSHKQEGSHISVFGCVKKNKKKAFGFSSEDGSRWYGSVATVLDALRKAPK